MVIFQTTFLMRKKLPDGDKHISQHELEAFHLTWSGLLGLEGLHLNF